MAQNSEQRQIEIIVNGQKAEASLKEMSAASRVLWNQLSKLSANDPNRAKLIADFQQMKGRLDDATKAAKGMDSTMSLLKSTFSGVGGMIAGAFAVSSVTDFVKGIFDITAQFQKFEAVLTNTLGSQSEAQKSLQMIKDFAASTPFEVTELTESFIKFANRGVKLSADEMRSLGDLSSSMGKSFNQLTEAALDAMSGENERLKEFGITAKKTGETTQFTFKGVTTEVKNTDAEIRKYLISLGNVKGVTGSMAAVSKTLEGQLSNLQDNFNDLKNQVGTALIPIFTKVIAGLVTFINVIKASPKFISENKDLFIAFGAALLAFNGAQIAATASTLYFTAVEKGRAIATRASAIAQGLLNTAMVANPIGAVIAAVTLLIGGFVALYNRSETVRGGIAGLGAAAKQIFKNIKDIAMTYLGGLGDLLVGIFTLDVEKIKSGLSKTMGPELLKAATNVGTGVGDAFNKGFDEKLAAEKAEKEVTVITTEEGSSGDKPAGNTPDGKPKKLKGDKNKDGNIDEDEQKALDKAAQLEKKRHEEKLEALRKAEEEKDKLRQQFRDKELAADQQLDQLKLATSEQTAAAKFAKLLESKNKELKAIEDLEREAKANDAVSEQEKTALLQKYAEQRKLIEQKYSQDVAALQAEEDQKALEAKNDRRMADAERAIIVAGENDQKLLEAKIAKLELEKEIELQNKQLTEEEKALIEEEYASRSAELYNSLKEKKKAADAELKNAAIQFGQEALQSVSDFTRIGTDKKIAEADRAKQASIKKLDEELKAGKISKDQYDLAKQEAEEKFDRKATEAKRKQARIDKAVALTQAIISTALAVIKALPNIGLSILAGVTGGLGIAKIAATPIPAFAKGGLTGLNLEAISANNLLKSARNVGSFSGGGHVGNTSYGIIGEKGAEWVAPNWMLQTPEYANVIGYLESQRVRKFAAGGPTAPGEIPAFTQEASGQISMLQLIYAQLQQNNAQLKAYQQEISTWQRELEVINDPLATFKSGNAILKINNDSSVK